MTNYAFPMRDYTDQLSVDSSDQRGMTLRQFYFAHVMQGLLASPHFTPAAETKAEIENTSALTLLTKGALGIVEEMIKLEQKTLEKKNDSQRTD